MLRFSAQHGEHLLPMVELIETSRIAVGELIDRLGRANLEAVLHLSARKVAGEKHQGSKGGEIAWHGSQPGTVCLGEHKVRVNKPRLRRKGQAIELANRSLSLDDLLPDGYAQLGYAYIAQGEADMAIAFGEKAVALNPSYSFAAAMLADFLMYAGRPEEGLVQIKKAMRLSPFYDHFYLVILGDVYRQMGRYDESVDAFRENLRRSPNFLASHLRLIATLVAAGQDKKARAEAGIVRERHPDFSLETWDAKGMMSYKDAAETRRIVDALRQAGLK
ncbi:MAG: hypothetical protein IID61_18105 [SAR324 cluster bacterium]|nr:hypothetical protein [SAR324 cluster bacterium]